MFSQIYNTARRILSRSPSTQGRLSEARESPPTSNAPDPEDAMVTTRRGTDTPGSQATPLSSAKKRVGKRELGALDTPVSSKRQKRAAPNKKAAQAAEEAIQDTDDDIEDCIVMDVPSIVERKTEVKLPIRRGSSLPDVQTPEQVPNSGQIKKSEESVTPKPRRTSARFKNTYLEVEEKVVEVTPEIVELPDEIPSSTYETIEPVKTVAESSALPKDEPAIAEASSTKKAHKRFGSAEPLEPVRAVKMNAQGHKRYEVPIQAEDDDSGSDSDEAPEVVTTSAAITKAAATEADTQRAQLAAQEKERKKREAREARIALEQAEKRKREEKKAKKLARQAAKEEVGIDGNGDANVEDDDAKAMAMDRRNLPTLLPDSLLASLPSQRAPTPPPTRPGMTAEELRVEKLNNHIKFLERSEKGPKDLKKGKLSVSVLRNQNPALPPKVNGNTKNVREHWLKGRKKDFQKGGKKNVTLGKMERRPFGKTGFLRGED